MKRRKLHKRLSLNKKTIANLEGQKMQLLYGGGTIKVTEDNTCEQGCVSNLASCYINCTTLDPNLICPNTCEPNTSIGGICVYSECQC